MKNNLTVLCISILFLVLFSCADDNSCPECDLIPQVGPCNAAIPIYYYDQDSMKCVQFIWGGCEGVVPFETLEACEECDC